VPQTELARIAQSLSDRDRAILQSLADYGLLQTGHLRQLHFTDHATTEAAASICRRTLRRLSQPRLVEAIEHRVGGIRAGSDAIVWRLGPAGDRLLRAGDPDAPRSRRREPSLRFLQHRLMVADVACILTTTAPTDGFELVRVDPEPASWRTYTGVHGARETLKPDLYAITAAGEYEDHWFIEVDRGTESIPTLLKQCRAYQTYHRSGREQSTVGIFPRILWLLPDTHRRDRLRTAIAAADGIDADLHRTHTYTDLLAVITGGAT